MWPFKTFKSTVKRWMKKAYIVVTLVATSANAGAADKRPPVSTLATAASTAVTPATLTNTTLFVPIAIMDNRSIFLESILEPTFSPRADREPRASARSKGDGAPEQHGDVLEEPRWESSTEANIPQRDINFSAIERSPVHGKGDESPEQSGPSISSVTPVGKGESSETELESPGIQNDDGYRHTDLTPAATHPNTGHTVHRNLASLAKIHTLSILFYALAVILGHR